MKIEEVETAKRPMGMARDGEMGGRFSGSVQGLSGLWDMPENFASQPTWGDGAKVTAVGALGMRADDKDFPGLGVNVLNLFDHCTVNRMLENDDIPRFERTQNKGERGSDHVISCVVFGCQAVARDFNEFEH